ncbi:apolipoprotein N-acyltransferase [Parerythrobacter jejuensis]|uniref:Apolipoprotein N-acyltransferase n=1 Tax=Parerythrobacter jejuensis TaxID=795812 RepID=A0A845AV51_9SPHN|nr:apolipoprotein N-acyltransferase [Parerythrobacter jejuensis]MXP30708.1 apolipoprotein N-acyltransferase [Parerythrobacter jejuensis]MXP33468.1 apolipoprotein N-acyltransferase [Parerythrobacter jejuensis]
MERFLFRFPKSASFLLGGLAALGFPPLQLWPVALLAMGLFVLVVQRAETWRRALLLGWLFGISHFTLTNNWIATAFTHQSEMPEFLGWLAVPLLALYLAIYPALAAAGAQRFAPTDRPLVFALVFAGLWIVTEWLRSWVFTGYAWAPFSLTLLGHEAVPGLAMLLPWFGTYALSGFAILIGISVVALFAGRRFIPALAIAALVTAGMYLPRGEREEGTLRYTVVQPDLDQRELNDPREYEPAFLTLSALSTRKDGSAERVVFWPESGLPDYLREGYPERYYRATTAGGDPLLARARIGQVLDDTSMLLTGAVDLEIEGERAKAAYNVVTALDTNGTIAAGYRKAHLVPYGEYLALRWLLEPLGATRLVAGTIDFWPGPGPATLDLGLYGRAGIQICYEIVFSGQVTDRDERPDYIFNPSNDGWFGLWGPPQHFAQARMRAIEEGLPVIRSTTTGISGVIDADGIVRASLGSRKMDALHGFIPPAKQPTLFSRLGNVLALLWAGFFLALSLVAMRRRRG